MLRIRICLDPRFSRPLDPEWFLLDPNLLKHSGSTRATQGRGLSCTGNLFNDELDHLYSRTLFKVKKIESTDSGWQTQLWIRWISDIHNYSEYPFSWCFIISLTVCPPTYFFDYFRSISNSCKKKSIVRFCHGNAHTVFLPSTHTLMVLYTLY